MLNTRANTGFQQGEGRVEITQQMFYPPPPLKYLLMGGGRVKKFLVHKNEMKGGGLNTNFIFYHKLKILSLAD